MKNNIRSSKMLYSIAIPALRQANFLPTALASIQAQTCRIQLAVMDASPDNSIQDVLINYKDILSYHRHGPDAGQSAAIQEGWDHTNGDVVAWLCADDYYFPYALEDVDNIFASHPEVDVVYGDSVFVDRDGNFLNYFSQISNDITSILYDNCISQPSCFVRRSALNRIGKLDVGLQYIMDWDLWTRLYKAGAKFYYINKPLSAVRMYPETKTASRSADRYAEINRHLKYNVGLYTRISSLLSFYLTDLLVERKSAAEGIVFYGLSFLRLMKHVTWKYSSMRNTVLYGIEAYSNKVYGECEIFLPLYGNCAPRQIVIGCRHAYTLQVHINGRLQNVAYVPGGEDSCSYVVKVNDGLIGNLLKLNLRSHSTKPWQLISLNIS